MTQDHSSTIEKTLSEADELFIKQINKDIPPGLAMGIIRDGRLIFTRSYGFANLEKGKPITADTVFRIMSISKTFTSIAIMQLWEQKKLDLDEPVNLYLKGLKVRHKDPAAPPVRIRHMLTHLSGIGETRNLLDLTRPVVGLAAEPGSRILSMPEYYSGLLQTELYPGEKWSYANHAFGVLAYLIECVSGEPFDQYMRNHVFGPLGMSKSDYVLSERVRSELAQGYTWNKNYFKPYPYQRLNTPGCGGIFSSVNEMALYTAALMNGGANEHGRVLQPETLQFMMTPQYETGTFSMGLGFFLEKIGDHLVAEHSGGWPGFISSMRVVPDQKLAVIAFTNGSNGASDSITNEILHRMLGQDSPYEKPKTAHILQHPEVWAELAGSYGPKPGFLTNNRFWGSMHGELEIYVKDGQLKLRGITSADKNGVVLQHSDPANPYAFKTFMNGVTTPLTFRHDSACKTISLDMGSYVLYKQPYIRSLKFKAALASGSLAALIAYWIGKRLCCKK